MIDNKHLYSSKAIEAYYVRLQNKSDKLTKVRKDPPATQSPVSGSANVPWKATALKA